MREKLIEIAKFYGDRQYDQTIEEAAELIVAIRKLIRAKESRADYITLLRKYKDVVQEIADIEIMTEQLKFMIDEEKEVEEIKKEKIERQLKRIAGGEDENNR